MKKLFLVITLVVFSLGYSQVFIPETSSVGWLITQDNQKIEYTELSYENGKVTYTNAITQKKEFLYDHSIRTIQYRDKDGTIKSFTLETVDDNNIGNSSSKNESLIISKPESPKLTSDSEIKKYLFQTNDPQYMKGKKISHNGTLFLVGGATCFLVGGLLNLSSASKTYSSQYEVRTGTPIPLIIGLVAMGGGVIMKVAGSSKKIKAIDRYKSASLQPNPSYYFVVNANGGGLKIEF